jgi:hypothetical protein
MRATADRLDAGEKTGKPRALHRARWRDDAI